MVQLFQLFHKYKGRDFVYIIPLVLLALDKILGHYFWRLRSGVGLPHSEDSQWYIDYANALMVNFSIGSTTNDILYFGYNILLTLLLAVFKDPVVIIFIQAVTASLNVILVFKISRMLFNRTTAVLASYFYYDAWDITLWSLYILSESFFISLLLLCVYFLLKLLESKQNKYKILFAMTALYMLVFRPTGIICLVFIMIYIMIRLHRKTMIDFVKKHRLAIGGSVVAVVAGCIYIFTGDKLAPLISSLQFNAKMVLYNVYAKGWIYDRSTPQDYYYKPDYRINIFNSLILSFLINNWDHVLVLYGRRFLAFLGKWVWEIDLTSRSGIRKFVEHLLPTFLFLRGTIAAVMNGVFRKASIIWLIVLSIFIFCILLFIDGMYRYRVPSIPFISIIAAYGADRILRGLLIHAKKYTGMLLLWNKGKY